MNFFADQARSRRATFWLMVMFGVAVLLTILIIALAVDQSILYVADPPSQNYQENLRPLVIPGVAGALFLIIALGTLSKLRQLAAPNSGTFLAELVGAHRLDANAATPNEKRLANIVEEMSIASGTPVPLIHVLPNPSINAFVAGKIPVLVVTSGAIKTLSRDELQGVVAHEFSHLLNGDTRLNMRLLGTLHGLEGVSNVGRLILAIIFDTDRPSTSTSSSSSKKDNEWWLVALMVAIGVFFWLVGCLGVFFAGLIQRAISRQREFLADASAVQFTRNPEGIAGALRKIATGPGAEFYGVQASGLAHFLFADGIKHRFALLSATHPPIAKRLARITGLPMPEEKTAPHVPDGASAPSPALGIASLEDPATIVARVGKPTQAEVAKAATVLAGLPAPLFRAARDPFEVRALLLAFLFDRAPDTRQFQLTRLAEVAPPAMAQGVEALADIVNRLAPGERLPLVMMAGPAVSQLSPSQFQELLAGMQAFITADQKVDLFEFCVHRLVKKHGRPPAHPVPPTTVPALKPAVETLLSTLAAQAGDDRARSVQAYDTGRATLPELIPIVPFAPAPSYRALGEAMDTLAIAPIALRKRILEAGIACVLSDRTVTQKEAEFIYILGDSLALPIPHFLAG